MIVLTLELKKRLKLAEAKKENFFENCGPKITFELELLWKNLRCCLFHRQIANASGMGISLILKKLEEGEKTKNSEFRKWKRWRKQRIHN